jgi:type IX secretion system PorP/SprF family membrane protein
MSQNKIVNIFFCLVFYIMGYSQDVNFSQFNAVSNYYNPAMTAAFNGNFRVNTIYRNQWIGLQDQPITSFCVAGDIKFNFNFQNITSDYFGGGIYFLTDRTQLFDWNSNEIAILLSYHKLLKKSSKNYLSIGMGIGVNQRSINYDNIFFEDQFDGIGKYNGTTQELLPPNIFARPELKLGLQYNSGLSKKLRIQTPCTMC